MRSVLYGIGISWVVRQLGECRGLGAHLYKGSVGEGWVLGGVEEPRVMASGGVESSSSRVFLRRYARCEYKDVFAKKNQILLEYHQVLKYN